MKIEPLILDDLQALANLQPPDWTDIIPDIRYYVEKNFCFPFKATMNHEIAGTGTAILYGETAWLAHIIVHPDFRNRGTGSAIVKALLDVIQIQKVSTCILTATSLGKPIYEKAGFKCVSDYVTFKYEGSPMNIEKSDHIRSFDKPYLNELYALDQLVTGENRRMLLDDYVHDAALFVQNDEMAGYYLPHLKEGPIIAKTRDAGIELLKLKCKPSARIVVPEQNMAAVRFLEEHGFKPAVNSATRMALGKNVDWKPENIFCRAGGNFG